MAKFISIMACIIVALECLGKATGTIPQTTFSADFAWMWWIPTAGWVANGLIVLRS